MKSFLDELWQGKIAPCEKGIRGKSEYAELCARSLAKSERFFESLNEAQRAEFEELFFIDGEIASFFEREAFCEGVRIGARMVQELFGDIVG